MKALYLAASVCICIFLASCAAAKWPDARFVEKHNYKEVRGSLPGEFAEKPNRFPMYPGGQEGINELIAAHVRFPQEALKKKASGVVIVRYVIDRDGLVKDAEVIKGVAPALDAEAIRVIQKMERWVPGQLNGQLVRVSFSQPFNFNLPSAPVPPGGR
ncbi:TonB family protein [Anseongella ginsenosidimutans]|uniref:TonB family protein n=1 Tax=Anseongella ginsenosidimutans TaxID=496056 RepID=A0A4R3KUC2_9SPHI|nr:energy transducer TonB [Anseongella ginsenosidimutans]QEC51544.1 energy transducer TonB [Anseongella ginsenosidimutans]TCS88865.1 TonB family protein [Anseongella ginsenosidimutans]